MNGARMAVQALGVFLPVLYLGAAALYAMHFGGPDAPNVRRVRTLVTALAVGAHTALLAVHTAVSHSFPAFEGWTTASAVAYGLALLFLATARRAHDVGAGAVVFGLVGTLQLLASAFGPLAPKPNGPEVDAIFLTHVLTSTAAASALLLSGLHGSLYLFVLRRMRGGRFGPVVERLPDLRTLAQLTRRAAMAGFVLLTLGVNFGIGWAHYAHVKGFHYTDPSVLVMIALWIHFGLVAFSRKIPGFSAQRASIAAALGLSVFLAAGLITMIPRASFHWAQ